MLLAVTNIVTGDEPNRDLHEDSDSDGEHSNADDAPDDEAEMILEVIAECLRSLFRIAVLVRQASPQDRFRRAMQHAELAFPDSFDIEHVEQKHPKIAHRQEARWLAQRLGSAIAKRRQFIKYCRDHKARLGADNEIERGLDSRTELLSSKATMFLKERYLDAELLSANAEEVDDAVSLMTATTTFDADNLLRLPRLVDLSLDGQPFECPICFTLQKFVHEKAWK